MDATPFTPVPTEDGSFTFFSAEFGEAYHDRLGARREADLKFVQPTIPPQKVHYPSLRLLDVCYGLGYNTAAALEWIWSINPRCRVEVVGLELDATVPGAAVSQALLDEWQPEIRDLLATLATRFQMESDRFRGQLLLGDARQTIQSLGSQSFDAIFLDPFSPRRCPQLWTVDFLGQVTRCLKPDGRLATYSSSAAVRTALLEIGLTIGSTAMFGQRSPGTIAGFPPIQLPPLSPQEQEHLQTRAAVPYRDPTLTDSPGTIVDRRQKEQSKTSLESTTQWRKRWMGKQFGPAIGEHSENDPEE